MNNWPCQNYQSMVKFYGNVGENQTSIVLPYPMVLEWEPKTVIRKMTCHEKVADSLLVILKKTLDEYGLSQIQHLDLDKFSGCLNVRKMRGGNAWSNHAFGTAVDLSSDKNTMKMTKETAQFARPAYEPFWKIVEGEGWVSLLRARNFDAMHFQAAKIC